MQNSFQVENGKLPLNLPREHQSAPGMKIAAMFKQVTFALRFLMVVMGLMQVPWRLPVLIDPSPTLQHASIRL